MEKVSGTVLYRDLLFSIQNRHLIFIIFGNLSPFSRDNLSVPRVLAAGGTLFTSSLRRCKKGIPY